MRSAMGGQMMAGGADVVRGADGSGAAGGGECCVAAGAVPVQQLIC